MHKHGVIAKSVKDEILNFRQAKEREVKESQNFNFRTFLFPKSKRGECD